MTKNLYSPYLLSEWEEFLKNSPDVSDLIKWINIHFYAEDIYSEKELKDWAYSKDFVKSVEEIEDTQVIKYVSENFSLDQIYSDEQIKEWIDNCSAYIKRSDVINKLDDMISSIE